MRKIKCLTVRKDAIASLWCMCLHTCHFTSSFWQGQLARALYKAEVVAPLLKDNLPDLWFIYGVCYFTRFAFS